MLLKKKNLSITTEPVVGLSSPAIISINVVFPEPDSPRIHILSPFFISKLNSFNKFDSFSLYLNEIFFKQIS